MVGLFLNSVCFYCLVFLLIMGHIFLLIGKHNIFFLNAIYFNVTLLRVCILKDVEGFFFLAVN